MKIRERLISFLYALIMLGLLALLGLCCIKEYALWIISFVLLLNICWLVGGILWGRPAPVRDENGSVYTLSGQELKKDRKNLLVWGFCCGVLWVGIILALIAMPISRQTIELLKNISYVVPILSFLIGLGIRYLIKK